MYKVKNEQGEWVEVDKPENGQRYRFYHVNGGMLESTWSESAPKPKVVVTSHSERILVAEGASTTLDIEIQDEGGVTIPVTDSFAVPIERVGGAVERTIGVDFVDGVASKTVSWPRSGEFQITERLINLNLPSGQQFSFDGLKISVYE